MNTHANVKIGTSSTFIYTYVIFRSVTPENITTAPSTQKIIFAQNRFQHLSTELDK